MPKYLSLESYINALSEDALNMYQAFVDMMSDIDKNIKHQLFAGQIAFYKEETLRRTFHSSPVIVMSFLKDHVNIFASANETFKSQLSEYRFTEKNTMQIKYTDDLNTEILSILFKFSLDNI